MIRCLMCTLVMSKGKRIRGDSFGLLMKRNDLGVSLCTPLQLIFVRVSREPRLALYNELKKVILMIEQYVIGMDIIVMVTL